MPATDSFERSLADVLVVNLALSNRMLTEFQMRRDPTLLEQRETHTSAHRQNAFEASTGDDAKTLDAGIIEHAHWLAQLLGHDRTKLEAMPLLGAKIRRRQDKIPAHHAREPDRHAVEPPELLRKALECRDDRVGLGRLRCLDAGRI